MRPETWPALLDDYVGRARAAAFAWGSNDCVSFTCGWHQLMTGLDVYEPFRGKYDSETSAFRTMHTHGVTSMEGAGRFLFGAARRSYAFTKRGDIVYSQGALGICIGKVGAFLTIDGLSFIDFPEFELGWSV